MPTYEYRCDNCGNEFEEIQSIKADALTHCPKCDKDTLKRIISGGNALIFKGSGFYLTDYKNKSVDTGAGSKNSDSVKTGAKPGAAKTNESSNSKESSSSDTKNSEPKSSNKSETKNSGSESSSSSKKSTEK